MKKLIRYFAMVFVTIVLIFTFVIGSQKSIAEQQFFASITMDAVSAEAAPITDELCPRCGEPANPTGRCYIALINISMPFNVQWDEQHVSVGCSRGTVPAINQMIHVPMTLKSWMCLNCGFKKIMRMPSVIRITEKGAVIVP